MNLVGRYGPVMIDPLVPGLWMTKNGDTRLNGRSPAGRGVVNSSVAASLTAICVSLLIKAFALGCVSQFFWNAAATAVASTGVPSQNVAPGRSPMRQVVEVMLVMLAASQGSSLPWGVRESRANNPPRGYTRRAASALRSREGRWN